MFDPVTQAHLARLGIPPGARCLEVGAGSGSIARWLAGRANLEVRALDLAAEPVPPGPWDVIHERLVLQHVPERVDVLGRLVAALAPGGLLLLEDFDTGEVRTLDRDGPDHELIVRVAQAFNRLLGTRGGVSDFAAGALRTLRAYGLVGTGASGYVAVDTGGTGWATVQAANAAQVRDGLVGQGTPPEDVDRFVAVMAEPDTIVGSSVLISTWGRRPAITTTATDG